MSAPADGLSETEKERLHAEEMKLRQAYEAGFTPQRGVEF